MPAAALTGTGNVTSGAANSGTSVAVNRPANATQDVLLFVAVHGRTSTVAYTTPPAGWALLTEQSTATTGWQGIYWKVMGASEATSYTWGGGGSGRHNAVAFVVTGADTTSLLDVTGGSALVVAGPPSTITAPSITTTGADRLMLGLATANTTGGRTTLYVPPGASTTVGTSSTTTAASESNLQVVQEPLSSAGASGTRQFVADDSVNNVGSGFGWLTSVKSAAVTTAPKMATFTDDFSSGNLSKWTVGKTSANIGDPTVSAGRVVLPYSATAQQYVWIDSGGPYDMASSSLSVEWVDLPAMTGQRETTLEAFIDSSNKIQLYRLGSMAVKGTVTAAGGVTSTASITTSDLWFRIRESATTVYFDTSANGTTWTQRSSLPHTLTSAQLQTMTARVGVGDWLATGAATVKADHVNLSPGAAPTVYTSYRATASGWVPTVRSRLL